MDFPSTALFAARCRSHKVQPPNLGLNPKVELKHKT
jgi:hypothetical protein